MQPSISGGGKETKMSYETDRQAGARKLYAKRMREEEEERRRREEARKREEERRKTAEQRAEDHRRQMAQKKQTSTADNQTSGAAGNAGAKPVPGSVQKHTSAHANTFYTTQADNGIMQPRFNSIAAFEHAIEKQQKALKAMNKQQYNYMLQNDISGMDALDEPIKRAEKDIDDLKMEMYGVMGAFVGSQWGSQQKNNAQATLPDASSDSYLRGMQHAYGNMGEGLQAEQVRTPNRGNMSPAGNTGKPVQITSNGKPLFSANDTPAIGGATLSDSGSSIFSKPQKSDTERLKELMEGIRQANQTGALEQYLKANGLSKADMIALPKQLEDAMGPLAYKVYVNGLEDESAAQKGMLHAYGNVGEGLVAEQVRKDKNAAYEGMLHAYGNAGVGMRGGAVDSSNENKRNEVPDFIKQDYIGDADSIEFIKTTDTFKEVVNSLNMFGQYEEVETKLELQITDTINVDVSNEIARDQYIELVNQKNTEVKVGLGVYSLMLGSSLSLFAIPQGVTILIDAGLLAGDLALPQAYKVNEDIEDFLGGAYKVSQFTIDADWDIKGYGGGKHVTRTGFVVYGEPIVLANGEVYDNPLNAVFFYLPK